MNEIIVCTTCGGKAELRNFSTSPYYECINCGVTTSLEELDPEGEDLSV